MPKEFIGKKVQFWPNELSQKVGYIIDVNQYGWLIKITESSGTNYVPGTYFISKSTPFTFRILE